MTPRMDDRQYIHGIRQNLAQFCHYMIQVFLVGMTIGMMRSVVPALSESEFGVPKGSFMLLTTFVVAFGIVKGVLNFVAGRLSERLGRQKVLLLGWLSAVPIPFMILYAPTWNWIVAATLLLGVNQGFAWSMTQASKLDLTGPNQRGFTMGLNEFSGYLGVAVASVATGYIAIAFGARVGLFVFGLVVILSALVLSLLWIKDTLPWAKAESTRHANGQRLGPLPRYPKNISMSPTTWEVFALMTWRDKRMAMLCQAGLVEKFVDALVWVFYPLFLYNHGLNLASIGWVVGIYGLVWGCSQLFTGKLSDHVGRHKPIVWGMWMCGGGVGLMLLGEGLVWWSFAAAVTGLGMALLYPNLSAAVSDIAQPNWRGSALGIYRFWRDLGYAIGALSLGLAANLSGHIEQAFWVVAIAMFLSGLLVHIWSEETHPGLNPADWDA